MKKFALFLITVVFLLISCQQNLGLEDPADETAKNGTITGYALYQNSSDSSDIDILLESSDGLRTASISSRFGAIAGNTTTDSNGYYKIEGIPEGVYTVYAASQNTSEKAVRANVIVIDGETVEVETLKLTVTGCISGTITYENSQNNNYGFIVYVAGTSYSAMTEKDGSFTITGVPAGEGYNLVISKGSFTYYWKTGIAVPALDTITLGKVNLSAEEINSVVKGNDGKDGTSIVWKGSFSSSSEIENPVALWAYFNTSDGCSYIYDGENWTLLAQGGKNNDSGNTPSQPTNSLLAYDLFGASFVDESAVPDYYIPGQSVVLPKVVCEDLDFAGWFADPECCTLHPQVTYDKENGNYIFTAPENTTGKITLYAGIGKVFTDWTAMNSYLYSPSMTTGKKIFISGEIVVNSPINIHNYATTLSLIGINNAVLKLGSNQTISKQLELFEFYNITVDGNGKYEFFLTNVIKILKIKNSTFKNLMTQNGLCYLPLYDDAKIHLFENCIFDNIQSGNSKLIEFSPAGATTTDIIFKDCVFYNTSNYTMINNISTIPVTLTNNTFNGYCFSAQSNSVCLSGTNNYLTLMLGDTEGYPTSTLPLLILDNATLTQDVFIFTNYDSLEDIQATRTLIEKKDGTPVTTADFDKIHVFVTSSSEEVDLENREIKNLKFNVSLPDISTYKVMIPDCHPNSDPNVCDIDYPLMVFDYVIDFPSEYHDIKFVMLPMEVYIEPYDESGNCFGVITDTADASFDMYFIGTDSENNKCLSWLTCSGSKDDFSITPHGELTGLPYVPAENDLSFSISGNRIKQNNGETTYYESVANMGTTKVALADLPEVSLKVGALYTLYVSYTKWCPFEISTAVEMLYSWTDTFVYNGEETLDITLFE